MKGLPEVATQHVVERPKHLDLMGRSDSGGKYVKIAMTLKMIERTKALCYDQAEFDREFGKNGMQYLKLVCKKMGLKKTRVVKDEGKIWIWSNDENK